MLNRFTIFVIGTQNHFAYEKITSILFFSTIRHAVR